MKTSIIINTCALGPKAKEITGSCSLTPHASRAYTLTHFLLPLYIQHPEIDEVIVSGEWVEGEGFTYVPSPSTYFSCVDALHQRHLGAEAASGDVLIFTHDDHILNVLFPTYLKQLGMGGADVFLPSRWKWTPSGVEIPLPDGSDEGYLSGHASVMTREAVEKVPWEDVEKIHVWDRSHTNLLIDAGLNIKYAPGLRVYDIEAGVTGLETKKEELE